MENTTKSISKHPIIDSKINLDVVLTRLRDNYDADIDERVVCVYQLGSRVYGTATEKSDWDFMMIVRYLKFLDEDHFLWECYDDGEINVALYDEQYFQFMCWEHRMEAIECICLDPKHKWLENRIYKLDLDLDVLRKMVSWIARLRWSMAKKRMAEEPYKAKKCLFHGLRYLVFGLQLIKYGRIEDYSEANPILGEIMDYPSNSFEELYKVFFPKFRELRETFSNSVKFNEFYSYPDMNIYARAHINRGRYESICLLHEKWFTFIDDSFVNDMSPSSSKGHNTLALLEFLKSNTIEELCKRYFIQVVPHSSYSNLIFLRKTISSPIEEDIVKECCGIILEGGEGWRVVSYPPNNWPSLGQTGSKAIQDELNWKESGIRAFEMIDGLCGCMYWHEDEWHVSSECMLIDKI